LREGLAAAARIDHGEQHRSAPRNTPQPRAFRGTDAKERAGSSPGSYSLDHSAQTYVFDPRGRLRLFVRHERIGADLVEDLRAVLREG